MTNKGGISVEGVAALTEPLEDAIGFLAAAHVPKLAHHVRNASHAIEAIARAYLALSEREAAKDAEIARLREALQPFVRHYDKWMDEWPDDADTSTFSRVSFGQLRAARAALTKGQSDAG